MNTLNYFDDFMTYFEESVHLPSKNMFVYSDVLTSKGNEKYHIYKIGC